MRTKRTMKETGLWTWIVKIRKQKRERKETTVFVNETRPAAIDPLRSECKEAAPAALTPLPWRLMCSLTNSRMDRDL